jgi:methylthioribose-1-phosphate isomerase
VAAKFHGVAFYVAAPTATIDLATLTGKEIPIENRPPTEMTLCKCQQKTRVAPVGK